MGAIMRPFFGNYDAIAVGVEQAVSCAALYPLCIIRSATCVTNCAIAWEISAWNDRHAAAQL